MIINGTNYGVISKPLTYQQAVALCALGSRILIETKHERHDIRYAAVLVDNVAFLDKFYPPDVTYREYGPLPDNLLTD